MNLRQLNYFIGVVDAGNMTRAAEVLHVAQTALSTQIEELGDLDDAVGIEDVRLAYDRSNSVVYALDLSNFRMVIDFLAKLLLITAIFADLILKATLAGWRNDRSFRASPAASEFDASAAAADGALSHRTDL